SSPFPSPTARSLRWRKRGCGRNHSWRRAGRWRRWPSRPPARQSSDAEASAAKLLGELAVDVDRAANAAIEIAEVQALVLRVRVGIGVLDADEQRGRPTERLGEGLDEGDGAAAAGRNGGRAIALLQRPEGGLEGRMAGVGVPPACGLILLDVDLETPGGRVPQRLNELRLHLLRREIRDDADADPCPRRIAHDVARVLAAAGLDGVHHQ